MNTEEYKQKFTIDDAVGWQCIDKKLAEVYSGIEPRHYPPFCGAHFIAGGTDPLDGVSIFDSKKQAAHFHFVSYGMSELYYGEEKADGEFSKWGFEFTFRLLPFNAETKEPTWAIAVMNNLARYVFSSGNWFEENQFISAKGPVRLGIETEIEGFVFTIDPELGKIETPHGEVTFLQMVGITKTELERLNYNPVTSEVEKLINELKKDNPLLITDLNRK